MKFQFDFKSSKKLICKSSLLWK